ncbi:MAG: ATP-dependent DNA helicase RecG [candidate division WS6 bacterium GW2011_GWF2_39_15]|uniref:Probable DNA 3'-5' helicase RecG n=1 Tax=candidate division WS6 bacterium GW2011_GWF2_39_15 TaxID=1619100 RepID=A0A0G0N046_9BACT|nr:MAG: ATP-dependent DNA helicase RecG [candidate division WS6 bacterium GW2011_GWF2_39_15]
MLFKLSDTVDQLPLVGGVKAKQLEKLGINTIKDLLFHIPFRYKDTSNIISIPQIKLEREGTVLATIKAIQNIYTRSRKVLTKAMIEDEMSEIETVWFNQPYLTKSLKVGDRYLFEGRLNPKQTRPQLVSPTYEKYYDGLLSQKHVGRITPFYPETANLTSKWLRNRIDYLFQNTDLTLEEPLPQNISQDSKLIPVSEAINLIHNPKSLEDITQARARLGFDEMLALALQIESQVQAQEGKKANIIDIDFDTLFEFISSLPYTLTDDQVHAIKDILQDLSKPNPMRRLLNGDVGSGKTVVAAAVMYGINKRGYPSILMAPTSILARQHFKTITELLSGLDIDIQLCTSLEKIEQRKKPQIIIGTHALLYQAELPDNIGLVVVDEQHRFGVNQRKELLERDTNSLIPHYLSMTATPIPRTLTNILFGDMSVSFIHELPKNRIPVKTFYVPYEKRESCYSWLKERIIKSGYKEQAFIIFPLVDESELVEAKSAKKEFETLTSTVLKDMKVALLHGQMKEKEKDEILKDFKAGKYSILIATPVVEVGIDIPNATIMVIENSERFGLAQLHQFRGRVGRNDMESYCYVLAGEQVEQDSETIQRLQYFSEHNSGFDVAEYDLQKRGPGEVFGVKQSGIPQFKIASITDIKLLLKCREVAKKLINSGYNTEEISDKLFR